MKTLLSLVLMLLLTDCAPDSHETIQTTDENGIPIPKGQQHAPGEGTGGAQAF